MAILCLAIIIIYSGLPEVTEWFFDEVKFRATPELKKLNSKVKLGEIYDKVDQWQVERKISQEEMTNLKLEEYVQKAINLVLKEKSVSANV